MTARPQPVSSLELGATALPAMDVVFIEGFTGHTVIGIHDSELHQPQPIVVDVHAGRPHARACDTDQIADTIDYGAVRLRLQALYRDHRLTLLEAFAEAIAHLLIDEFGAAWVRVKVVKPRKFDDVEAVGVVIERTAPSPEAGSAASVLRLLRPAP